MILHLPHAFHKVGDGLAPDDAFPGANDITDRIQGCGWRMWLQIPVHVARFDLRWRIE